MNAGPLGPAAPTDAPGTAPAGADDTDGLPVSIPPNPGLDDGKGLNDGKPNVGTLAA